MIFLNRKLRLVDCRIITRCPTHSVFNGIETSSCLPPKTWKLVPNEIKQIYMEDQEIDSERL